MDRLQDIKRIAEGLYPEKIIEILGGDVFAREVGSDFKFGESFNPFENDADAFKVLEWLGSRMAWDMLGGFLESAVNYKSHGIKAAICDIALKELAINKEGE